MDFLQDYLNRPLAGELLGLLAAFAAGMAWALIFDHRKTTPPPDGDIQKGDHHMNKLEIAEALRNECSNCSERNSCDNGKFPGGYCPNTDAADLIEAQAGEIDELREALSDAIADLKATAQEYNTCSGCASRCEDDELPEDAPDCSTCKRQSNWRWRG